MWLYTLDLSGFTNLTSGAGDLRGSGGLGRDGQGRRVGHAILTVDLMLW